MRRDSDVAAVAVGQSTVSAHLKVLAEPDLDPARRAEAEHTVGCSVGTLTADEHRDQLRAAGFATATITPTHTLGGGLYSAIVQGSTPPGSGTP